jgi:hypothetical protein
MMAREVKKMPGRTAEVTPNGLWPLAQTANVEEGGSIHEGIPIEQIPWTPARLTIRKEQYPIGVVLLNEINFPAYGGTIQLDVKTIAGADFGDVDIIENAGWPHGTVVLFKD